MAHSVSVAGVVIDTEGRILVIQRCDTGEWQIPGGVLEAGERLEDGVRREIFEESGIEVQVDHLTGVYHHVVRDVVALVYRCTPTGGQPALSAESSAVAWWDTDTVMKMFAPMFAVRVADAISVSGTVASRNHDGHRLL